MKKITENKKVQMSSKKFSNILPETVENTCLSKDDILPDTCEHIRFKCSLHGLKLKRECYRCDYSSGVYMDTECTCPPCTCIPCNCEKKRSLTKYPLNKKKK